MKSVDDEVYNPESETVWDEQYDDWLDAERCVNWPFPVTNGVRNPQSRALLDTKQKSATIKPNLDNEPDALL